MCVCGIRANGILIIILYINSSVHRTAVCSIVNKCSALVLSKIVRGWDLLIRIRQVVDFFIHATIRYVTTVHIAFGYNTPLRYFLQVPFLHEILKIDESKKIRTTES